MRILERDGQSSSPSFRIFWNEIEHDFSAWRALLCLARAPLAAPFGPSAMRFLATARRLGCQRRGFAREQARPVGLMGADEDADPPASRFALPRPVIPKHENSKTPATTLLSQSPEGMLRCHGSAYAQEEKQWRDFDPNSARQHTAREWPTQTTKRDVACKR